MILVTGGTGFVGRHVARTLREEDRGVRCLVRDAGSRPAGTLAAWGCEIATGDMTDRESVARAVEGCEAVVHLVAIRTGRREQFERIMVEGTRGLVAAAKEAGVRRFLLMSALGTDERTMGLTPYFWAKWTQERDVAGGGFAHTVFRPSFIFGREGGVLPIFARQVRWSPVVPVLFPERRLQPIWVEDVAAVFAKALETPASESRTFELGGPDTVAWSELYERIAAHLGKRRLFASMPPGVVRAGASVVGGLPRAPITPDDVKALEHTDQTCDIAPAVETFGIRPISLDEQLRRAL